MSIVQLSLGTSLLYDESRFIEFYVRVHVAFPLMHIF
jgi:hypothetical protein